MPTTETGTVAVARRLDNTTQTIITRIVMERTDTDTGPTDTVFPSSLDLTGITTFAFLAMRNPGKRIIGFNSHHKVIVMMDDVRHLRVWQFSPLLITELLMALRIANVFVRGLQSFDEPYLRDLNDVTNTPNTPNITNMTNTTNMTRTTERYDPRG